MLNSLESILDEPDVNILRELARQVIIQTNSLRAHHDKTLNDLRRCNLEIARIKESYESLKDMRDLLHEERVENWKLRESLEKANKFFQWLSSDEFNSLPMFGNVRCEIMKMAGMATDGNSGM